MATMPLKDGLASGSAAARPRPGRRRRGHSASPRKSARPVIGGQASCTFTTVRSSRAEYDLAVSGPLITRGHVGQHAGFWSRPYLPRLERLAAGASGVIAACRSCGVGELSRLPAWARGRASPRRPREDRSWAEHVAACRPIPCARIHNSCLSRGGLSAGPHLPGALISALQARLPARREPARGTTSPPAVPYPRSGTRLR